MGQSGIFSHHYCNIFFFRIFLIYKSLKEQHLLETEIFYNIIHIFTLTFDQFNVFLLN